MQCRAMLCKHSGENMDINCPVIEVHCPVSDDRCPVGGDIHCPLRGPGHDHLVKGYKHSFVGFTVNKQQFYVESCDTYILYKLKPV